MNNKKDRIEYIDAMRGLAIVLVLQSHVSGLCLNIDDYTPNYHFVSGVPLFFFISGFLSKQITNTGLRSVGSYLYDKAIILLVAATLFMAFRAYLTNVGFIDAFRSSKYGFWFTFSLFQFILISICCQLLLINILPSKHRLATDTLLLIIALFMYSLSIPAIRDRMAINENIYILIDIGHWKHFLYYALGRIVKNHYQSVEKIFASPFFVFVTICAFVMITIYNRFLIDHVNTLYRFTFPILWITICFMFFRHYQEAFSKSTLIGICFQFIGKRTLDIYYLHLLFLPEQLSKTLTVFHDTPIPVIEYFTTTIIVSAIIILCLVVSSFIRLSPVLAHYLFGAKKLQQE